jgi:hypothetical protein
MKEVAGATTGSQRLAINGRADMKEKKADRETGETLSILLQPRCMEHSVDTKTVVR